MVYFFLEHRHSIDNLYFSSFKLGDALLLSANQAIRYYIIKLQNKLLGEHYWASWADDISSGISQIFDLGCPWRWKVGHIFLKNLMCSLETLPFITIFQYSYYYSEFLFWFPFPNFSFFSLLGIYMYIFLVKNYFIIAETCSWLSQLSLQIWIWSSKAHNLFGNAVYCISCMA